jgi:hypothetical protein
MKLHTCAYVCVKFGTVTHYKYEYKHSIYFCVVAHVWSKEI